RYHDSVDAAAPQLGRNRPPPLQRRILQRRRRELVLEVRDQPVPAVELPEVDHLRPRTSRADGSPHAEAQHVAFLATDRAPVRVHVMHVAAAVVSDDVDQLVDVDLVVHERDPCSASPNAATVSQNSATLGAGRCNASQVTPIAPSSRASATSASGSTTSLWP